MPFLEFDIFFNTNISLRDILIFIQNKTTSQMKHLFFFFIISTNLYAQDIEDIKTIDEIQLNYSLEINNKISNLHTRIPNTNYYFIPFGTYQVKDNTLISTNYTISILQVDSSLTNSKVEDFSSSKFEKKGLRVLKNDYINVNNYKGKHLTIQSDLNKINEIIFIDEIIRKTNINISYLTSDKEIATKIVELINSIVIDTIKKNETKELFKLDLKNSTFKLQSSSPNIWIYTKDGLPVKNNVEPNFIVTILNMEEKLDLKGIANYMIGQSQKYGLESPKTFNELVNKNSYQVEILGKVNKNTTLMFLKLVIIDKKIAVFQGNTRKDIEQNLEIFKTISKSIK
jgi:hypothetical protein